jgi:3',5'-nucleoside bisphosphate phosphatase
MISADLHMHTKYSPDGELAPSELIALCRAAKLLVIAITDHNTIAAIGETIEHAQDSGVTIIPGIEIDCSYNHTDMHLLGYGIKWDDPTYKKLEAQLSQMTMDSLDQMIHNLHVLDIPVRKSEVIEKATGRLPSPELIAEVLLNNPRYNNVSKLDPYRTNGSRSNMPYINFYLDFFAQGKPAYVHMDYMPFSEAISIIKDTGGIPVVAHPGHNFNGRENVIRELIDEGAEGIEVYNNYHNSEQIAFFEKLALEKKILITAGSDFHGKTKPLIEPGMFKMGQGSKIHFQEQLELFLEQVH